MALPLAIALVPDEMTEEEVSHSCQRRDYLPSAPPPSQVSPPPSTPTSSCSGTCGTTEDWGCRAPTTVGRRNRYIRTFLSSSCAIHTHTRTHKVAKTSQFLRRSLTGRPSRLQLTSSSWLSSMALTDHWVQGLSTWEGGGGGGLGPPRGRSRTFHSPSYRYGFPPLIVTLGRRRADTLTRCADTAPEV